MIKRNKPNGNGRTKITFVLPHAPARPRIYVVGDFNDWKPRANPLVKRSNGTRSAAIVLQASRRYAFRYLTEDGEWFNDEAADGYEPSGHGSENCIVST